MTISDLRAAHHATLANAMKANVERTFHAHWPEAPSGKIYGETANDDGLAAFQGQLNNRFDRLPAEQSWIGEESSPYGFSLGITYPQIALDDLISRASAAQTTWQSLTPEDRASILVEALERGAKRFFEIGYATQHTTGQGFVMGFQASGPHAFDRALEATAMALAAQSAFVSNVLWTKPMGKISVSIDKSYRMVPKGINLVIGCSTFPVWNTVPGMFAGLATGNSVIVKPHPGAVYPIAIVIADLRAVLTEIGLDANIIQLAVDTSEKPLTLELVKHPAVRVIDYTGGPHFGAVVEKEAASHGKTTFMEKAGVNCVILDSTDNLDAALENLAFSLTLYSGQMCTAPQNIFIAKDGMMVAGTQVSVDDVAAKLREKIDAVVFNERSGATTLGAIQNPATSQRIEDVRSLGLAVIRDSARVDQPGFEGARTVSPIVLQTDTKRADIYTKEWFGPVSFLVVTDSFEVSVAEVVKSVREQGALSALVYTTNNDRMTASEDAIVNAGAPVAFNFNSFVWVNQSAAFSDFHGTGANPAGNATFADWSFVTNRYNVIGVRKQA
ncbi:MAG: phenylacetic acid degradation protein PaaN [Candidatus Kapabacteria bacterium]|nr:phenylacetic acid degradation protein PaaN [Candidatus Kapabacteria bacterium]MBP7093899.1 phenylacetic acid degradation protein PaaN [Candidatus Kapabacteria bacterium]